MSGQHQAHPDSDDHSPSVRPDDEPRMMSPLHSWRFRRFRALGFDDAAATLLVKRDVDWHDAERLVSERGCPTAIATKILV